MKITSLPAAFAFFVFIFYGSVCAAERSGEVSCLSRVDSLFAGFDSQNSPGAAVLIVNDGKVLLNKGYGMANLEHGIPITPETVFDIASVSKQFTGFAISLLAERGMISPGDDIRKYIPEMHDFGHTVTIAHLLHHTSGIRNCIKNRYFPH